MPKLNDQRTGAKLILSLKQLLCYFVN